MNYSRSVRNSSLDRISEFNRFCYQPSSLTQLPVKLTGGGRWIRTTEGVSQQIYSLPPLAAWVSLQQRTAIVWIEAGCVNT